jgi:hypothetical protein
MKSKCEPALDEFKFHYHFDDSVGFSDKYFMAHDIDEAKEMFEYACRQDREMESLECKLGKNCNFKH